MCLTTTMICPIKARKDIVCYKEFIPIRYEKFNKNPKKLMTPIIGTTIENPCYIEKPILMDDSSKTCKWKTDVLSKYENGIWKKIVSVRRIIEGGMIHAHQHKSIAIKACGYNGRIYKCIIPKGTLYFKGINNDICAKQMLVVERCT